MYGAILMPYVLISSIKPNVRPPFDLASSKCSQFLSYGIVVNCKSYIVCMGLS